MFNSTCVRAVGYDSDEQNLTVKFPGGRLYVYHNVPAEIFTRLVEAESPGREYNAAVKGKYEVEEVK